MLIISSSEIEIALIGGGLLLTGIVGKRAGWFKIIGGTNALLREQNQELRNQNTFLKGQLETTTSNHEQDKKEWMARHQESLQEIAKLQGKVDTLTALPLDKIDATLKEFTRFGTDFVKSNNQILQQLQKTAVIDKATQGDGGILVRTKDSS